MNGALLLKPFKTHQRKLQYFLQIDSYTSQLTKEKAQTHSLTSLQCGTLLQLFTNSKSYHKGKQLHAHMISSGLLVENTYLNTKLSSFYAICGNMSEARIIFNDIILKNSFSLNCMIRGYACNGFSLDSLALYREMLFFGQKADNFTYPFVLKACGDLLDVEIGRKIHSEIVIRGLESDIYVGNSLLSMYSKCRDMEAARKMFDRMPIRDLTSWNTMISGYTKNGNPEGALLIFSLMSRSGERADCATLVTVLPACANMRAWKLGRQMHGYIIRNNYGLHISVINSLIYVYCNCNFMVYARWLFEKYERDTVSWNSMILGYAKSGDAFESLRHFNQMLSEGIEPDQVTFIAVLGACDQITALQFGMSVHAFLTRKGFSVHTIVGTALGNLYAKCGRLGCSCQVFEEMPEKNLISWSAMIAAYGLHGKGREAIAVFNQMKAMNIRPDEVTFTSVLSACSHAGLVNEGCDIFYKIAKEYDMERKVEHYSCMVDLLGRAGRLDEAYKLIKTMEVKPTHDIWASLLFACRVHHNVKLAEIAALNAFDLNPKAVVPYISLSNIYAVEKRWDDVERVRAIVRSKGLKKQPGCSYVELEKVVHCFSVGDKSHPQSESIYSKLEDLHWQLKEAGYTPDTSSVLYDVNEEVKEKMLWDHSERLAIAFALINTAPRTVITITKNLRICCDCHTVTKLISKHLGREIIMRDAHRFHHFKNGICSCGDYW
ncbi:pentatricopeptide repeat-containing protein At3g12770-like [Macadamia integrifolia]|uniref:pentatricopeptide repeat-containing protein At3g12770-like n=1 Tax=Macadamia integrifolia TaxID=60698 RepID=UPI001C4FE702|nr:pentatricopeptide repeat-containing protein At3g12770-like [Macadamia integrifolia]